MSTFELDADQIHPDWTRVWMDTLPEAARAGLLDNRRLAARISARLGDFLGAAPFDTRPKRDEALLYAAYLASPERALHLTGLMLHGRRLARIVAGADVRLLVARFGQEYLVQALSVKDFLPEATETADPPAPDALERHARLALRDWIETLSEPLADRLTLTLPREPDVAASHLTAAERVAVVELALTLIHEEG